MEMHGMRMDVVPEGRGKAEAVSKAEMSQAGGFVRREFDNPWPADLNWSIVYHRIKYSRENGKPCDCKSCESYLAYIHEKYWSGVAEQNVKG